MPMIQWAKRYGKTALLEQIMRAFAVPPQFMTRDNLADAAREAANNIERSLFHAPTNTNAVSSTEAEGEGRTLTLENVREARRQLSIPRRGLTINIAATNELLLSMSAASERLQRFADVLDGIEILPPDPAERENALRLLETVVGAEDLEDFKKTGGMIVKGASGTEYVLSEGAMTRALKAGDYIGPVTHSAAMPDGTVVHQLVAPATRADARLCFEIPGGYHPLDKMIAEILMIQTDEEQYLRIANVQSRPPLRPYPPEHQPRICVIDEDHTERISP